MRASNTQHHIRKCASCGVENHLFASFCIGCGEPFGIQDDLEHDWAKAWPAVVPASDKIRYRTESITLSGLGKREAVIGAALLLLAFTIALYQWHKVDEQSAAYRQGLAAAQNKDWDKAADSFARAGDHPNAEEQVADARRQVADRDGNYLAGITAEDQEDWKSAIKAFGAVLQIQPSYQDTQQRLEQALQRNSTLELGGLVLRETRPPDDGLYYQDGLGHSIQLPGSDSYSVVRGISRPGTRLVYDRPRMYVMASALGDFFYTQPNPDTRELAMATTGLETVSARSLPGLDPSGSGVFAPSGLWWTALDPVHQQSHTWYVDTVSPSPTPVEITDPASNRAILAFDPPRSRVIWGQPASDSASGQAQTVVTMTDARGNMPWLVGAFDGKIESASVNRDGRWLLLMTLREVPGGSQEQTVWAQSLEVSWDPKYGEVPGSRMKLASMQISGGLQAHMSATFLPSDGRPVKVAVDRVENALEHLTIYSLDDNNATEVWYYDPAMPGREDRASFSNAGQMLASPRRYPSGTLLELFDLSVPDFKSWLKVPLPIRENQPAQVSFAPRNNYLITMVQKYKPMTDHGSQDLYTARIGSGGELSPAKLLAVSLLNGYPTVAAAPGGTFLAYINTEEELHAIHYDGTGDAVVASNVVAVWSLGNDTDLAWAR